MGYSWDFTWVFRNYTVLLAGLITTVLLTLATLVLGLSLAVVLALSRIIGGRFVSHLARVVVEIFRDLPVLVVMVWLYFCLPIVFGRSVSLQPFWIAVLGLSLNFAAVESDILRAAYGSIPQPEVQAAVAFGFTPSQLTRTVILPQAFWRALAPTLGQAVNTLKLSSLASFITVSELFYVSNKLIQETFRPLEFYTALAVLYLIIILPFSVALQALEDRLELRFIRGVGHDSA